METLQSDLIRHFKPLSKYSFITKQCLKYEGFIVIDYLLFGFIPIYKKLLFDNNK